MINTQPPQPFKSGVLPPNVDPAPTFSVPKAAAQRSAPDDAKRVFSQEAPFSEEAEEAVIGAIMINPDAFPAVAIFLKPEDFYFLRHQYIWQALERLYERNEPVDYLTLSQELRDHGKLDDIGGLPYITRLINNTPTSIHAEFYGHMVERTALRRRLLIAADEIKALAHNETIEIDQVFAKADSRLQNVIGEKVGSSLVPAIDLVGGTFDQVEERRQGMIKPTITTGLTDLDALIGKWVDGKLYAIQGATHMGKSLSIYNYIRAACKEGKSVLLFTMEISSEDVIYQLIAMEMGVNWEILRARMDDETYNKYVECAGRVAQWKLSVDDTPSQNPRAIMNKARHAQRADGVDIVFVDYFQLCSGENKYHEQSPVTRLEWVAGILKQMTRILNVPVIVAEQVKPEIVKRQDKRPGLYDANWSPALNQAADGIIGIYRDVVYNDTTEFPNQIEYIVCKNRVTNRPGTVGAYLDTTTGAIMNSAIRRVDLSGLTDPLHDDGDIF